MRLSIAAVTVVLLFGTLSTIPPAAAVPEIRPGAGLGPEDLPTVLVESSDPTGVDLVFELPVLSFEEMTAGVERFQSVAIPGGGLAGEVGQPALPVFTRLVAIPDEVGVEVAFETEGETAIPGIRLVPMQADETGAFAYDAATYSLSTFDAGPAASVGSPAICRDLRIVPITFRPVRYNPAAGQLIVNDRIRVRIDFAGRNPENARAPRRSSIPPSFDRLYRDLVVNYEGPPAGAAVEPGAWLLITPNDNAITSRLQALVDWRRSKGQHPVMVTTGETGTSNTSIKNYIQNAFDTWDPPLEHVVLAGDVASTYVIATWYETLSGFGGEGDHPYTQLAGNDVLSDIHIGRLSFGTTLELEVIVNKILGYEITPYLQQDPEWFTRACLVGDPYDSGYSTVQAQQWVKNRLEQIQYTDIDTIYDNPFVSQMTTSLNKGGTIFTYRGIYGMSGWTNSNTYALTNGWKMPFGVMLTCGTGSFAGGTARSEAFLRANAGSNAPKGAIGAIGTATTGTHTKQNNCIFYGLMYGLLYEEQYQLGASLTRGKYELYLNFQGNHPNDVVIWSYWNNLMGDSAVDCWTGYPELLDVAHPATVPVGTNSVRVSVNEQGGAPVEGALVCLIKGTETYVTGLTDASGAIELPVSTPTAGTISLTVTKHNRRAVQEMISVAASPVYLGYQASVVDDDNVGTSSGNGNGVANPGESIELRVQLKNFGNQAASGITATLTSEDPYVTISDATETYPNINGGASAWCSDDFDFALAPGCPHGRVLRFGLEVQAGTDSWHSLIDLPVVSADLVSEGTTLYNVGGDGILGPGETGELSVKVRNNGGLAATGTVASLTSPSAYITITDYSANFGTINPGTMVENTSDRFTITAASDAYNGYLAIFEMIETFAGGARDTTVFTLTVGQRAGTDPVGPDRYGYLAYDNTDVSYADAPVYAWVELDPTYGGDGTEVPLTDYSTYADDSEVVDLPFPFVYYGTSYTRATICSNGWIAMGGQFNNTEYRNWTIPGAGGPQAMIAGFWDDLRVGNGGKVLKKYDAANHRFIVEWSRVRNEVGGQQTFEIILYDPVHHQSTTGDGFIVMQYSAVNNNDYSDMYATAGIENWMQDDGVLYTFHNQYPAGAASLTSGRAVRYVPTLDVPSGTIRGQVTNASMGGTALAGAEVVLLESGRTFLSGPDGRYSGTTAAGSYTVVGRLAGFQPDTVEAVVVSQGQVAEVNLSLVDIAGPTITGVTNDGTTTNTTGPYSIRATVSDPSGVAGVKLYYRFNQAGWNETVMTSVGPFYVAAIPGRDAGTRIDYYVWAKDAPQHIAVSPPAAPAEFYTLYITEMAYDYTVENPEDPAWQLGVAGDNAATGVWVRVDPNGTDYNGTPMQPEDDHTTNPGVLCFVTGQGSVGGAVGDADVDGGCTTLLSPVYDLDGATMAFFRYHRWYAEGGSTSDDDFVVSASSDGGQSWTEIERVPDIDNTWRGITRDLLQYIDPTNQVRVRFVACDEGAGGVVEAGIDDVSLEVFRPNVADVEETAVLLRTELGQNRPNPFNPVTRIRFDLASPGEARIDVFDAGGRLVRTLVEGSYAAGRHETAWDGKDDEGRPVGSGVYFYRLEAEGRTENRRMTVLR